MKYLLFAILFISSLSTSSQSLNIIPAPVKTEIKKGSFIITPSTKIISEATGLEKSANFFNEYLRKYYGFQLATAEKNSNKKNAIVLNFDRLANSVKGAYNLEIDSNKVYIGGDNEEGVFYGIQTLIQLLPTEKNTSLSIPQLLIKDYPRFAYRGLHLDVGRHFFPVDFIKQYVDFIALHKMNTFHWHLTEDQGWRIEIKKYPKLTEVGSCRNGTIVGHEPGTGNDSIKYCGYYTQNEIREVVQYAADRYITIIPEIEMPGHSSAAIAAYPELSCFPGEPTKVPYKTPWNKSASTKEVQQTWGVFEDVYCPSEITFQFLQNVLDEVIELFPSKYIHIGGDECPKDNWKRSLFCQQLMKDSGIKDEVELQSYFIHRIEKYLNSKGRNIIGWDEILEGGVAPNATVMSWRGVEGGIKAARQHHNVIMSPTTFAYFDYSQSKNKDSLTIGGYLPLEIVYKYEPYPKELSADEKKYVLGAQANLWTEYITNPSKVEYMIFPRVTALSEVLWSPASKRNWTNFKSRLQTQYKRYDFWNVRYNTKGIDNE